MNTINRISVLALAATLMFFASSCKKDDKNRVPFKASLSIEPYYSTIAFSANGQTAAAGGQTIDPTFEVTTNEASWSVDIVPSSSWLSWSKEDENTFTLSAQPNNSGTASPTATVTVTGIKADPVTFTVTQAEVTGPSTLAVLPLYPTIVFTADGKTAKLNDESIVPTFIVQTNELLWNVELPSWLSYTRVENMFTLAAQPNMSLDNTLKQATVTVTAGNADPVTFNVVQEYFGGALQNTVAPFAYDINPFGPGFVATGWTFNEAAATNSNISNRTDADNPLGNWTGLLYMSAFDDQTLGVMPNGKLFQTLVLDAGTYDFSVWVWFSNLSGINVIYLVAALGVDLPNVNQVSTAHSYIAVPNLETFGADEKVTTTFTLPAKSIVSLGFLANLSNAEGYFTKVELQKK